MRALRRVATPASFAAMLGGCSLPVDEFKEPASTDAALTSNGDAASYDDAGSNDAGSDACFCVREVSGKCKEWSSVSCAR